MSLITEAYFREGDFTRLDLIHQTYDNLNACLSDDMLHTQQLYVGLSAGQFVRQFRQRALVLFKLMLLERKVLFFQSPVKDLCGFLLTLMSLHPGMLERGLDEAARMVPVDTPPLSPCDEEGNLLVIDELNGRFAVLMADKTWQLLQVKRRCRPCDVALDSKKRVLVLNFDARSLCKLVPRPRRTPGASTPGSRRIADLTD